MSDAEDLEISNGADVDFVAGVKEIPTVVSGPRTDLDYNARAEAAETQATGNTEKAKDLIEGDQNPSEPEKYYSPEEFRTEIARLTEESLQKKLLSNPNVAKMSEERIAQYKEVAEQMVQAAYDGFTGTGLAAGILGGADLDHQGEPVTKTEINWQMTHVMRTVMRTIEQAIDELVESELNKTDHLVPGEKEDVFGTPSIHNTFLRQIAADAHGIANDIYYDKEDDKRAYYDRVDKLEDERAQAALEDEAD